MQVLLTTTSDEMRGKVTKVLTDCGFEVVDWSPGSPAPAAPEFAVIDGLDAVVEAFDLPVDIVALVTEEEIRLFPE